MFGGALEEPPAAADEVVPVQQEDAWTVIQEFFKEKGLVRQQLDSYNEFTSNTMQARSSCCCCQLQ